MEVTLHRTSWNITEGDEDLYLVGVGVGAGLEVKAADEGVWGLNSLDAGGGGGRPELLSILLSARETAEGSVIKII